MSDERGGKKWTPIEDGALIAHADRGATWPGWAKLLPGRTVSAINCRRSYIGITSSGYGVDVDDWTPQQRFELARGMRELCATVGHNPYQCMAEIHRQMAEAARKEHQN
jgi:hypothetical protein